MLTRLSVQGFKSLLDVDVELAPLVVLMGPNAAGKSNLLEALLLLSRLATEQTLRALPAFLEESRGSSLACAEGLAGQAWSAVDVLDRVFCHNPQTKEVWAAARQQAAQLGLASASFLPGLSSKLTANRLSNENRFDTQKSAALTLSWLAFDFGARQAGLNSARQLLLAAIANQEASTQSLFLTALQAYYNAQATRSAVSSTMLAEKSAETSLLAAETRYRVGTGTPAERLQAKTAYSQAQLNRIKAEGEAKNALGVLANLMGLAPQTALMLLDTTQQIPDTQFVRDIEAMMQEAKLGRPDLKAAEAQLNAAMYSVDQARAQGRPTISISAGPAWQESAGIGMDSRNLALTVNVPIFAGFDTHYRVRAAEAQLDQKTAQRDRLRQQVALDVWKAYQSLNTATQSLQTAADLVSSAEQSERVALGRYQAGVGNVLDVLTAQSALASARLQRIQATLEWNYYRASLAQAMGTLDYSLFSSDSGGKP